MSKVIVIGAGIIGLWTSYVLSLRGHKVKVLTKQYPDFTTSASAACVITPLLPSEWGPSDEKFILSWGRYKRTITEMKRLDEDHDEINIIDEIPSYEFGYTYEGEKFLEKDFNIKIFKNLPFSDFEEIKLKKSVNVENHVNEINECTFGVKFRADFCNTELFLSFLHEKLIHLGVEFELTEIKEIDQLYDYSSDVIFNCTGFESTKLFHDDELYYIRGQSFFVEDNHQNENYFGIASGNHAIFKHKNGFYVGSYFIANRNNLCLPNKVEYDLSIKFIKNSYPEFCKQIGLKCPEINLDNITRVNSGVRPFRISGPRVDTEVKQTSNKQNILRIVHNYGHGAHGWTIGYATAEDAINLAEVKGWLEYKKSLN